MTSTGYLRYPHIHGDLVTFTAEDDVWLAPAAGGPAWRLSCDGVQVSHPRFARDGSAVAWTGWRDGGPEVYLAPAEGGGVARLTYWSDPQTRVAGWTPCHEVLAITAAAQPGPQFTWAYAIPMDRAPRKLPFGPVADLTLEPPLAVLLTGRLIPEPAYWKRYRGGAAGRLWVATADRPRFTRILTKLDGQFGSPMIVDNRIVFLADHEGTANIYSCAWNGTDLRTHTSHRGFYVRNPSTDGRRVVYQLAGDVWALDDLDAEPRRIALTIRSPRAARSPRMVSAADHLGDLDCDETGQASVIEVRGTIHWLTHADGPARMLSGDLGARARMPRVLGTTGKVVWVADSNGADAVAIARADGEPVDEGRSLPVVLAGGQLGSVTDMAAAPSGAAVAVAAHDGRVLVVDVPEGTVRELATSDAGPASGLAWSPDSAWLAWSQPGQRPLSKIRLAKVTDGLVADVTEGRFADTEPVFTADGRYLAFLSTRDFDPVPDVHSAGLAFPAGGRPYLVLLAAAAPSPFAPTAEGRPMRRDWHDCEQAVLSVDIDGLADRVVSVPVAEGRYSSLYPVRGGLAWLRSPAAGVLGDGAADADARRQVLELFDLRRAGRAEPVAEADWFTVSGDGTRLVVRDRGGLRVLSLDLRPTNDPGTVDLTRARFLSDPIHLWRTAYAEAGRLMRRDFWDPEMSGVAWTEVLDTYRPLLDRIGGASDFADLLWEVFGELSTSHALVIVPTPGNRKSRSGMVGQLGADIGRDESGRWLVDRVLPGESSDPWARSPLAAPGMLIRRGEELVSVDGQPVDSALGLGPLLTGTAGRPVELRLRSGAGDTRRVVAVPLGDDRRLRYQDWVAGRRRLVREQGGGRLGYLHIPDMMEEGWAHFHRDFRTEVRHDALIVDTRGNRGGRVSQLVLAKLAPRVIGWKAGRWLQSEPYPRDVPRGAVVFVADECAGSDGDIMVAAARLLKVGPVVGARTWGGVTGFDVAGHLLVDGTRVTVPRYAFTFSDGQGSMENHGVAPDVEVLITPDDWAAGRDTQLEAAVRLALEELARQPAASPPATH